MAPSVAEQLKDRIKKHQKFFMQMKAAKEKKNQSSQAIIEHLKLAQKARQELEETGGSQGAQHQPRAAPIDIRVLTATFDNMQM